jgi:2-keto-4-pentenoate hydratase
MRHLVRPVIATVGMMPDLKELALKQLADYDALDPGRIFDGPPPIESQADAYALQMEVAKLRIARGERLAGYKIGCIGDVVRKQLQMDRVLFGHVWASELHESGAKLDPASYAKLAIEGEFAVRPATDIPDAGWLQSHKYEALFAFFPVIELHNYVLRTAHPSLELIANNGIHAGAVLPLAENAATHADALLREPISVYKNGEMLGETRSDSVPRGPFASLCQLVDHLALYGIHLKRGQIILTGTPLPLYPVQDGDRIEVRTRNFGQVNVTLRSALGCQSKTARAFG